jgi:hypothetical protein
VEQTPALPTPTAVIAAKVRELRGARSAAWLAGEMRKRGCNWTRIVVTKLETGRRHSVSVEELLALSHVLDVAPVNLLLPWDDDVPYRVTAGLAQPSAAVRRWACGTIEGSLMPGVDRFRYLAQRPHSATARTRVVDEDDYQALMAARGQQQEGKANG